jgi:FtsZ-binding cell division protein ZapB
MNERASSSEERLAQELERLREQRRALGEVLRADLRRMSSSRS